MRKAVWMLLVLSLMFGVVPAFAEEEPIRIGIVYKQTGNPYYEAALQGFEQAQAELGFTFTHNGPSDSSNEGQIQIIESYIQQGVDAIAIAANDAEGCVSVLQMAMEQGIVVVSFDSRVTPEGRNLHIDPVRYDAIANEFMKDLSRQIDGEGKIAILSTLPTMDNQNKMIKYVKEEMEKEEYSKIELVTVAYGGDLTDKSYQEMQGLIDSYPDLKGLISPAVMALSAAANCVQDNELEGQIKLMGCGLPSEMAEFIESGVCESIYLWNPIDLGYCTAYACVNLIRGTMQTEIGACFESGHLGTLEIIDDGTGNPMVVMDVPYRFDATNINDWKDIF